MALTPSLAQTIQSFIDYNLEDLNTNIPARVLSYSNEFQKATVQPIITERYRDDKSIQSNKDEFGKIETDMPVITGVPVVFQSANNGCVNWPVRAGDIVLLLFSQRSLDSWLHTEDSKFNPKTINPEDNRKHDYSDAIAIPGIYPFKKALGSHPENFQIRYNVETDQECSLSFTPDGDMLIDVPGKIKINCNGWESFNKGAQKEQIQGDVTIKVEGDYRKEIDGNYNTHVEQTRTDRVVGNVLQDYQSLLSTGVEGNIIRQSRNGKIDDNAASDILRNSGGDINDNSSGSLTVNTGGTVGIKSGSTMILQHSGVDLDGSGVPSAPSTSSVPTEGSGALIISPAGLKFVETHNSSFQYSSKFIVIDNPTEGTETITVSIVKGSTWITLSKTSAIINGFGQELLVVSLNKSVKDLAIGEYNDIIDISGTNITVNLEIRS